jgi:hypothetical protein
LFGLTSRDTSILWHANLARLLRDVPMTDKTGVLALAVLGCSQLVPLFARGITARAPLDRTRARDLGKVSQLSDSPVYKVVPRALDGAKRWVP